MKELSYNKNGFARPNGRSGFKHLYHKDGRSWWVAYTLKELEPRMEAFYAGTKSKKIIHLHLHALCEFTDLKVLVLIKCRIDSLPAEIGQLTQLTILDLSDNQLTSLPAEIGQLTQLTTLDLSNNQLTSLPAEISQLTQLTTLDLSNNQLTSLPAEISQLTQLTELELRNNPLISSGEIVKIIANFVNIRKLLKDGNPDDTHHLSPLPIRITGASISKEGILSSLNLSNSNMSALPAEIGQLTELQGLHLEGNQITTLPPEIGNLKFLHTLYLSGKEFSDFDCSLLVAIEFLSFSGSSFLILPQNMPWLHGLDLSNCSLHQIPQEVKSLKAHFVYLDLSGNSIPEEEIEALRRAAGVDD
ncbi:MAG: leucine-rich repeat domain-containing protein [Haliscomenobacter sp.]|nr:leucine-rich repeat domain-containing protein [Haliscomenobacter sp.]